MCWVDPFALVFFPRRREEVEVREKAAGERENIQPADDKGAGLEQPSVQAAVDAANAEVNTEPTEAQKEAGNYKKGHVQVGTFDITIENPAGSIRKGVDANGKEWESKMNNTYGYFRGTESVDGDHIDVFLSNDIDGWNGRKVFVVDQYNPDGSFDEHKVMLGFNDADEAKSDYLANYEKGWEKGRRIDVTAVNLEDFEKWIESSKRKTKPFAEYKSVKSENAKKKGVRPTEVERLEQKELTEEERKNAEAYDALVDFARQLGIEVTYIGDFEGPNERGYVENGVIHINPNMNAAEQSAFVLGHEFVHTLEGSEAYDALVDYIKGSELMKDFLHKRTEQLRKQGSWKLKRDMTLQELGSYTQRLYKNSGHELTDEEAIREIVADFVSDVILSDQRRLQDFIKNAPGARSIFRRILDAIVKLLKKVTGNYGEMEAFRDKLQKAIDASKEWTREDGTRMFNLTTIDKTTENADEYMRKKGVPKDERERVIAALNSFADMARDFDQAKDENGNWKFPLFNAWNVKTIDVDENGVAHVTCVVKNAEYTLNIDFSTICKKRKNLDALLNSLAADDEFSIEGLMPEDIAEMNKVIKAHGLEIACGLCFVDARRYGVAEWSTTYAEPYNDMLKALTGKTAKQLGELDFGEEAGRESKESKYKEDWDAVDRLFEEDPRFQGERSGKPKDVFVKARRLLEGRIRVKADAKKPSGFKVTVVNKVDPVLAAKARHFLNAKDLLSSQGFDGLKENFPELYAISFKHRGSAKAKSAHKEVPYNGEIVSMTRFAPDTAYAVGGVRNQSFSDFVAHMVFDYIQMYGDLAAKGLPLQAYTKEMAYARLFGTTGAKINMSALHTIDAETRAVVDKKYPKETDKEGRVQPIPNETRETDEDLRRVGLDANGNYVRNDESVNIDEAIALQQTPGYDGNIGIIVVGLSYDHIMKLMADPNCRMIIPYHASSINSNVAAVVDARYYTDYTNYQNTCDATGKKVKKDYCLFNKRMKRLEKQYTEGSAEWNRIPIEAAEQYVRECEERGHRPKFPQFAYIINDGTTTVRYENGKPVNVEMNEDGKPKIHDQYYKMLEDFSVYNSRGEYCPQGAVRFDFSEEMRVGDELPNSSRHGERVTMKEYIGEMLTDEQQNRDRLDKDLAPIREEVKEAVLRSKERRKRKYSIMGEQSSEYGTEKAEKKAEAELTEEEREAMKSDPVQRAIGEVVVGMMQDVGVDVSLDEGEAMRKLESEGLVQNMSVGSADMVENAIRSRGIVMPNLQGKSVAIVKAEGHPFNTAQKTTDLKKEVVSYAEENGIIGTMSNEESGDKGEVNISKKSINKFVDDSASDKSVDKDIHLSVLPKIKDVIRESIEAEVHADYEKVEGIRSIENPINKDMLIHRCYGAVEINGKTYRVKITLKEDINRKGKKTYSYEVTKIELLAGQTNEGVNRHSHIFSNNSISAAKLLNGVEKSYDKGKYLLDESEKVQHFKTSRGEVYGFVKNGKIYLDPKLMNMNTPIHEYTHIWDKALQRANPELWERGKELMRGLPLWNEVKNNPAYADIADDEDLLASEVHSRLTGTEGEKILREQLNKLNDDAKNIIEKAEAYSLIDQVKQWLADAIKAVRDAFGRWSDKDLQSLTWQEFAKMPLKNLVEGVNMKDLQQKSEQTAIVRENNPAEDDYHTWIRSASDIKTFDEMLAEAERDYEDYGDMTYPDMTIEDLREAKESGYITVYSSKPIKQGIFVTPSRMNANEYAGGGKVYSKRVPVSSVAWIGQDEGQYAEVGNQPAGGKVQMMFVGDKGNVIPPSKRFNQRKADERYQRGVGGVKPSKAEEALRDAVIDRLRNKIKKGAELFLPNARTTDGTMSRNNSTPGAKVANYSETAKPRFSRKPDESIFDYASRVSDSVDRSVRERVSARDEYEKKVKSKGFQTKEALQNSMLGLQELMLAIDHASGNRRNIEDIPDFENPILGENRLSSVNKEEMHQAAKTLFKPLMSAVAKLSGNGEESGKLYDYMFAKHGLERDAVMRQREAQREFDKYKKANPNGTKTIKDFIASLEGKDYAGLTALTAEDSRVKLIQSLIDSIDEQMKATDDKSLLRKLGGQKKRLKEDLLNAARYAADDIRKAFESNHNQSDINELWKRVKDVNDNTLRKLYESGLLTKEAYDDISSMYPSSG